MHERTKAAVFVAAWLASMAGVLAAVGAVVPGSPDPSSEVRVTMVIEGPGWTIEYDASTTNGTAFLLMEEASANLGFDVDYVEYGWPYDDVLITSINGTRSGDISGYDWHYCVNGRYATRGALHQVLGDGDVVLWVYAPMGGSELCG